MIVAGFGFRADTGVQSLQDAYESARGALSVDALATVADKATDAGFKDFAQVLNLPVQSVVLADLNAVQVLTQSSYAIQTYGTGSVAEAAALAAAGPGARLVGPRTISQDRRATCAIAIGDSI